MHFRIIYYISLHSLLKEKETNRPLARFDSNKTSTTRTRKTETFVRSKKDEENVCVVVVVVRDVRRARFQCRQ
ncbi:unnamed protein product [Bathycoccus prasinos]